MQLRYQDTVRVFDAGRLLVPESRFIKRRLGMNPPEFFEAVREMDGDALLVLWALACQRAGEPIGDLDEAAETFDLLSLRMTGDDPVEEDEESPTGPGQ